MCDNELSGSDMGVPVLIAICTGVCFSGLMVSVGRWIRSTVELAGAVYSSIAIVGLLMIPTFLSSWSHEGFRVEYLWEPCCLSPMQPDFILISAFGVLATKDVPWLLADRQWLLLMHHVLIVGYVLYMFICLPPNSRMLLTVGMLLESGSLASNIAWCFHGRMYTAELYRIVMTSSNLVSVMVLVLYGMICPLAWYDYLPVVSCLFLCHVRQQEMHKWYTTYQLKTPSE